MSDSPRTLLARWPSLEAISDDFKSAGHDVSSSAISKWAQRGKIPPEYWLPLVGFASDRNIAGVTFEALASMHARRAEAAPLTSEARP